MTADSTESPFLLLLPPSVVSQPDLVERLMAEFQGPQIFHHQVLDRVTNRAIELPSNYYSRVHLPQGNSPHALNDQDYEIIFKCMAPGGMFSGSITGGLPALMAGFAQNGDYLQKPNETASASVSLSLKRPSPNSKPKSALPLFKRANNGLVDDDDDDELIDENDLIDSDITPAITLPAKCDPGPGKKRRKACKDCTCGLKEAEEQQVENQRSNQKAVLLNEDDTAEIDFTVPGKTTGSCGSCALGDAFRCDGCPYLGLPPFKPGEVVSIAALGGDDL